MRLPQVLCFGASLVALLAGLGSQPAAASGGEDWPHFCRMTEDGAGGVNAFRIHADDTSSSGYMLELLQDESTVDYVPASFSDTDSDGKTLPYYQVFAIGDYGVLDLRERQVLLFVQKDSTKQSTGDVQITWDQTDATFYPKPMDCSGQ